MWEQKDIQSYELPWAHKKRSEISGFGLVARPVWWAFHGCQRHNGLGCACNMKVCVVVSKSRLWEHILLFNSWPSHCPSCPSSPPSFLLATFRVSVWNKLWRWDTNQLIGGGGWGRVRRKPCDTVEIFFELLGSDQFSYRIWCLGQIMYTFRDCESHDFAPVTQHFSVSTALCHTKPELFFFSGKPKQEGSWKWEYRFRTVLKETGVGQ